MQADSLVNGWEWAYIGNHDPPILGSVRADDILVEYTTHSIDGGVHHREAVWHYAIDHGTVKREAPAGPQPSRLRR
jgi:hypothetical protein